MIETINFEIDSEDKKHFEELTGMKIGDCMKILLNSLKYGGKLELDPFYSDENIDYLIKVTSEVDSGKANLIRHDIMEKE